jgi:hypothetical protein
MVPGPKEDDGFSPGALGGVGYVGSAGSFFKKKMAHMGVATASPELVEFHCHHQHITAR